MPYLFLQPDYDALRDEIARIDAELRGVFADTAVGTEQTSETWHDNFLFEEGQRQLKMLGARRAELAGILAHADVVEPAPPGACAHLGSRVVIRDETGTERAYRIGSYLILERAPDTVSYVSPLGALLFGAAPGEERTAEIGGRKKTITVLRIA